MKVKALSAILSALVIVLLLSQSFSFAQASALQSTATSATPQATIQSGQNAPDCFAMDFVFLIDQSRSMSRPNNPNDPLGQRFNAPRYALDWLANNRLARMMSCPDMVHRMGVISFGTTVKVQMDLTALDPNSADDWKTKLLELEPKIEALNLEGTDPKLAFEAAKEMLDTADQPGNLPRKRGIILLTDGQPCTGSGLGCSQEDDVYWMTYWNQLSDQIQQDFSFSDAVKKRDEVIHNAADQYGGLDKIPAEERNRLLVDNPVSDDELYNSVYIWVVAMNDAVKIPDDLAHVINTMAVEHNGELIKLNQNLAEIPAVFNKIMSDLAGVQPTILSCGNLAVNPYLSGVSLDIYKAANGLEVELDVNGNKVKNGEGSKDVLSYTYNSYGATEHYLFDRPPGGLWKIVCSDPDGAQVSFQPFNAQVKMVEPVAVLPQYNVNGANSDPNHPWYLKFQIRDTANGNPLKEDITYPLEMRAVVVDPNNQETVITHFKYVAEGQWMSEEPVPVNLKGDYQVTLTATADCVNDPERADSCQDPRILVAQSSGGKYSATDVNLFKMVILKPVNTSPLPLHGSLLTSGLAIQPINIEVELQDLDGKMVLPEDVLTVDPDQAMTFALSAGGKNTNGTLSRSPDLPGRFIATVDDPAILGEHILTVNMSDVYKFETWRPQQNTVTLTFTRSDPLLNNPLFYRGLIAALIMLLTVRVIYLIRMRTFPLLGTLTFVKDTTSVPIGLGRGKRWFALSGAKVPAQLKDDFRRISVSNLPIKGRGAQARRQIQTVLNNNPHSLYDGQSCGDQGWQVTYTWGRGAVQKDLFWAWTAAAVVVAAVLIVLAFVL